MANNRVNWKKLFLELMVVFLGVSGSFFINNWRDSKNNIELEQRYINSFVQNIDSNIVFLKNDIGVDTVALSTLKNKMNILEKGDVHSDSLMSIIQIVLYVSKLDLQKSTFDDIKYSGNLNIIRDYNIKEKIISYYNLVDGAIYIDGYYNNYFSDMILPYMMNNFSFSEGVFFNKDPQNQRKVFNYVAGYYSMRMQRTEVLKEMLNKSELLKKELVKYMNTNF